MYQKYVNYVKEHGTNEILVPVHDVNADADAADTTTTNTTNTTTDETNTDAADTNNYTDDDTTNNYTDVDTTLATSGVGSTKETPSAATSSTTTTTSATMTTTTSKKEYTDLLRWTRQQQHEYRYLKEGKASSMFQRKIDKLKQTGFEFKYVSVSEV